MTSSITFNIKNEKIVSMSWKIKKDDRHQPISMLIDKVLAENSNNRLGIKLVSRLRKHQNVAPIIVSSAKRDATYHNDDFIRINFDKFYSGKPLKFYLDMNNNTHTFTLALGSWRPCNPNGHISRISDGIRKAFPSCPCHNLCYRLSETSQASLLEIITGPLLLWNP